METIKLFGLALEGENFSYEKIAEKGLQCGYIVDKGCSTNEVYKYLCSVDINTNTTFYSTWEEVTSKKRMELFIDQVLHYMSTYGTDYKAEPYIPNNQEMPNVNFKEFKKIKSATKEEILDRCDELLYSGVALNEETINDIFRVYDRFNYIPEIDNIRNKEAKMKICFQKNILPTENNEFVRYLIYKATEKTLLIKDTDTINEIKLSDTDISDEIKRFGEDKLSECFLRHKAIFLAFRKSNNNNKKVINRLRRLALRNHKPQKKSYWEEILNNLDNIENLPEKIKELKPFKKVALIEAIRERVKETQYSCYIIRNGKYWIKENDNNYKDKISTYKLMEGIIYNSLLGDVKKDKTFYIPNYLDIKVPKSEKTFIGNIPMGTEIDLPNENLIIGINRKGKDGADDFDLSRLDIEGDKIGWNSNYYNSNYYNSNFGLIYSGDMTSANPEATELIYFKTQEDGLININRYNGEEGSKFTFFIAREKPEKNITKGYMVKKENIIFQTELISDKEEKILGIKSGNKFIIQNLKGGNKKVSNGNTTKQVYIKHCIDTMGCKISLKQLLLDAGLKEDKENPDIDFRDIKKDQIVTLF